MFKNPKTHIESYLFPALFALGLLVGTFIYFSLPFEVSVPLTALMSIFLMFTLYFLSNYYYLFLLVFTLLSSFLGLTNAAWQIQTRSPNFLEAKHEDKRAWVVGQVGVSASYNGRDKVTLENVKIYDIERDKTPNKIRISSSQGRLSIFNIGDWVAVETKLSAPKGPRYKNDYNFRRRSWMDEIGATGYVMGQVYKTSWPKDYKSSTYRIQHARNALTEKIITLDNKSDERAVMAALMTGKRTHISSEIYNAYRSSGLAHLLAISGLHIGLIGGFVFFATRRLFGLSEKITLRYNTKIPAAMLAIIACLAYTAIAGGTLPTLRAFIMAAFIFMGFVVGRLHNTLRIFMMTLSLVLLLWPESLLTASFQMSFAAVFSLTMWNEFKQQHMYSSLKIVKGMTYTKGVFLTSVVAGLATMPIAAWHFGEIHFTGFVVNVLAIPLTAFLIMPFALLAVLFVPFGLEQPFLKIMEKGVGWLNSIAMEGANFPYGHYVIEQNEVSLLAISVFVLLLCLYINKFKKLATICLLAAVYFSVFNSDVKNDLLWLREGKTIIMGDGASSYLLVKSDGSNQEKYLLKRFSMNNEPIKTCDSIGCVVSKKGVSLLVVNEGEIPTEEDCRLADLILESNGQNLNICSNMLQIARGVKSGEILFNDNNVLFVPYSANENRIWH